MDRGRLRVAKRTRLQTQKFLGKTSKKSKGVVEWEDSDDDVVFLGILGSGGGDKYMTNSGEVSTPEGSGGGGEAAGVDGSGSVQREMDCVDEVKKELDIIDVKKASSDAKKNANEVSSIKSAYNEKDDANSHADTNKSRGECSEEIHVVVATVELHEANDVSKKSSMEEESHEVIGTESTDEEQDLCKTLYFLANVDRLVEPPSIALGDAQRINSVAVDDNPSMEEQSLAAVGTESTNMEPGHSHLLKNDGMSQGREATIVGFSKGQQPALDDVEMIQSLPFVKNSPIWKYLESLEIFQKFPQKPHFLPLIKTRERAREGYAIAKMMTFARTVEDAIKLSVNDPVSTITDCLEIFHQLESHGFDAKPVENRLRNLLSLKEKQQMMDEKKNKVERQISELTHKRVKLAADIYETGQKIKVYEQQLALAFLEKEEVDRKISILKTSLDVMETEMQNTLSCLIDENSPL